MTNRADESRSKSWRERYPRPSLFAAALAAGACLLLVAAWGKHLLVTPAGTVLSLGSVAPSLTWSALALTFGSVVPLMLGLLQMVLLPPRKAGLVSLAAAALPLLVYALIMLVILHFKGIGFD